MLEWLEIIFNKCAEKRYFVLSSGTNGDYNGISRSFYRCSRFIKTDQIRSALLLTVADQPDVTQRHTHLYISWEAVSCTFGCLDPIFCVESTDCAGIEPLSRRFWSTVERILLRNLGRGG